MAAEQGETMAGAEATTMERHAAVAAGLTRAAAAVDRELDRLLPKPAGLHGRALEAMRYAVFVGGKRLRPYLTLAGSKLFDVPETQAIRAAAAIEVLHTYSLVHDDLPCMDDDDLRRGKPTTHRQFDEATAVLAGDGLLTIAFEILAEPQTHPSGDIRARLVSRLAKAAGGEGMIGGQMIDMRSADHQYGEAEIILLQRMKTGALFEFAAEAGPILANAGEDDQRRLREFARDLGLAFQVADDLIDATGAAETAGKAVGKDAAQGKATLVTIYGVDGARREAKKLAERAADHLSPYGRAADELRGLPFFLLDRAA
jgi:farnesyl diphosphate synthase